MNGTSSAPNGKGPLASPDPDLRTAAARVAAVRRRGRARLVAVSTVLLAATAAAFCFALSHGDYTVPLPDVLSTLFGGGDPGSRFVIVELRLPRALLALLVGCCFGMSGTVFQTLLRNPLASPDVIGVSSGAGAAVVLAGGLTGLSGTPLSFVALAGSLVTGTAIYLLARRGGVTGHRLVLVGLGIGMGLSSLISYQMTRAEVTEAQNAFLWLSGSLNGRSWPQVWPLLIGAAVLVPLTALAARALPVLQLGDDTAGGLGARVERDRRALLACAMGLAGIATAAAGPVGFVAFLAPPIARRLVPGQGAALLPSAAVGALLVSVADFAGQHVLDGTQLPVGIVTSVIGAPYLLWLLARANRVGQGG